MKYRILCLVEAGILEDFYNNYLAEGNNIEFKEIEDSEHNFVRLRSVSGFQAMRVLLADSRNWWTLRHPQRPRRPEQGGRG